MVMNTDSYNKGRSYCYKLNRTLYRDILHDSWLHWYEKTSRDLFDEPISRVIRVIKLTWMGYYVNKRKVENRNVFVNYDVAIDHDDEYRNRHDDTEMLMSKTRQDTPEDIMIAKEMNDVIVTNSPKLQLEIYLLAVQGFRPYEICKILDMSKSHTSYYFTRIKHYLAHFN